MHQNSKQLSYSAYAQSRLLYCMGGTAPLIQTRHVYSIVPYLYVLRLSDYLTSENNHADVMKPHEKTNTFSQLK